MKIKVSDLKRPLTVTVTGEEEWLQQIYSDFPVPAGKPTPRIRAEIVFTPVAASVVEARASLSFTPFVSCSRCLEPLPWKIERTIEATYRVPPTLKEQEEQELEAPDLDDYWIDNGTIDVEALLNEEIQLAVPAQTVLRDEDGNGCPKCRQQVGKGPLYQAKSGTPEETENPFAVLKNLNLSK